MDGYTSSLGWSPINPRMGTTAMVTHYPKECHLPSQGWSSTIQNMVTNLSKYGHPFSNLLSPMKPRMVKHHPQEGNPDPNVCHQTTQGRPPTIIRMVTHCPNDMVAHLPEWSPNNSRMVTHHLSSPGWSTRVGVRL